MQPNVSFNKRQPQIIDLDGCASSALLSTRMQSQNNNPMMMTLDKDFLIQLENSLKRLAKSNEKVKQVTREKEQFEKQYIKIKDKLTKLKEERNVQAIDREHMI